MTAAMAMPGNTAVNFLVHFFGTGLADAGLEDLPIHDLSHSCASWRSKSILLLNLLSHSFNPKSHSHRIQSIS